MTEEELKLTVKAAMKVRPEPGDLLVVRVPHGMLGLNKDRLLNALDDVRPEGCAVILLPSDVAISLLKHEDLDQIRRDLKVLLGGTMSSVTKGSFRWFVRESRSYMAHLSRWRFWLAVPRAYLRFRRPTGWLRYWWVRRRCSNDRDGRCLRHGVACSDPDWRSK